MILNNIYTSDIIGTKPLSHLLSISPIATNTISPTGPSNHLLLHPGGSATTQRPLPTTNGNNL
ncbi:hypothetical protein K457DRAFT_136025 [Linnemannia elongata AG-77]|uniref:Uncharacterized protein n=1 Tax=Linnemannia elongata AG-77 TaxID=1314771 RepID=A0A197K2U7_9FUNG|nr:hypothetical protein K457DRAFT_136025 [Linnemannia elongata AG-77]